MRQKISALVPFFNENQRLLAVVSELLKVPELSEIVCVDDGSTDHSSQLLAAHFPQVTIENLSAIRGKLKQFAWGVAAFKQNIRSSLMQIYEHLALKNSVTFCRFSETGPI